MSEATYPHSPGFKDRTVSRDNAHRNKARFNHMQIRVLALYRGGFVGTADAAAARLDLTPFQVRPRCSELLAMGELRRTTRDRSVPGATAWILEWVP